MSKVDEYRQILRELNEWDAYLLKESGLPGPRANLELAHAVAEEGNEAQFLQYLAYDDARAPTNSPEEFLAFCGVLGLGRLFVEGKEAYLSQLRAIASDRRWRIREAVAFGLQRFGRSDMDGLLDEMEKWMLGDLLERRAVVAALCEPRLLSDEKHAVRVFDVLDAIMVTILEENDRKSDEFRALRKALGYGWSVAVAAQPSIGHKRMERWIGTADKDTRWIMKQNLKKKRLARVDPKWVSDQLLKLKT